MTTFGLWANLWRRGGLRLFAAVFASLALAGAQTAVLAHASSKEAQAPGHNAQTCLLHVNGDRPASAVAPEAFVVVAPQLRALALGVDEPSAPSVEEFRGVRARGPPPNP